MGTGVGWRNSRAREQIARHLGSIQVEEGYKHAEEGLIKIKKGGGGAGGGRRRE
jgi:hypothetical protein